MVCEDSVRVVQSSCEGPVPRLIGLKDEEFRYHRKFEADVVR